MTLFAYALLAVSTSAAPVPIRFAQMLIRQRIIVRIPTVVTPPRPIRWKEKSGPRCLQMNTLAGAAITQKASVDLYLRGGARVRAKLDDECPALDYYQGFYISPNKDGQVCSGRDVIHSRAGGQCGIDKFRLLVPER